MMSHPLSPKLRQLRLSGILDTLDVRVAQTVEQHLAPLEFLALLLDDELERRSQRQQILLLSLSGCDPNKTLVHFDFSAAPGINRTLIQDLASCLFIQRHENLLLCGPTGVGKSHLANAIAIEALKRHLRVVAKPTHRLVLDLQIARSNGAYPRMLARILSCDLLLLDDFGLQTISPQAAQDLYEIITQRYEKGSLIVTSNRAFEEWGEVFSNDLLASAALDRLTHHSHTLVIRGDSYRQRSRRKEFASISSSSDAPLKPES
jgi:DNA replication protein DnaC